MILRAIILSAFVALIIVTSSAEASKNLNPVETEHFIYYMDSPGYLEFADSVLSSTRKQLITFLNDSLSYKPKVYLISEQSRFDTVVSGYFPDWGAAAAMPARRMIAVKSPDHFTLNRSLEELLAHEYCHLALAHRCKMYSPPRWFDEGLAMMVSMEWSWSDNLAMSKGAVFGQFIDLKDIEQVNRFNSGKAHLAYAQSYLAVNYLFDAYGVNAVNTFLDRVTAGDSYDKALLASTGSNQDDFDKEFRQTLVKRFNVLSLLMDTIYFWLALALIVVIGGALSYRRRQKYYKKWEEHEQLHSTDFDYGDPDNPEQIDDDEPWRQ